MYKIFGIPNCNTVKKALNFFDEQQIEYEFVNFKKTPPKKSDVAQWKKAFGDWPVNKKGPTFRKIREDFEAADSAVKMQLLLENTSAIKRPIVVQDKDVKTFGFSEETYLELF